MAQDASQPLISVITPVYNAERYLGAAIESVLVQTHRNLELILVDDGSTDGSGRICDSYAAQDPRVRVIHQQNAGAAAARNVALDHVRGAWLCFVDDDDFVAPEYLATMLDAAQTMHARIAVAEVMRLDTAQSAPPSSEPAIRIDSISGREACGSIYAPDRFIMDALWAKLYRRELFEELRIPTDNVHEDTTIMHRLLYPQERIALCKGCFYGYRDNPQGIIARSALRGEFDALDALNQRIAFYERMGDEELAQNVRATQRLWQAEAMARAYLAHAEDTAPDAWNMPMGEVLKVLGERPQDAAARGLLAKLLDMIRAGGRP